MPSRMTRYYGDNTNSRSERNVELYETLYDTVDYNVSNVATLEKTNEIDIDKLKEMLNERDNYKKRQEYLKIVKPQEEKKIEKIYNIDTERNYDIKDVLNKAKEEKKEDPREMFIRNKRYDYLLEEQKPRSREIELEQTNAKLKAIINTITSNIDLNKLSNAELSLDLLDDLKSNTTVTPEIKKKENTQEMDKSFYTSNMDFSDKDFEQITTNIKPKKNKYIKILLVALLFIIVAVAIFIIYVNV